MRKAVSVIKPDPALHYVLLRFTLSLVSLCSSNQENIRNLYVDQYVNVLVLTVIFFVTQSQPHIPLEITVMYINTLCFTRQT